MFHAYVQRFDVTGTAQKILGIFAHLNKASLKFMLEYYILLVFDFSGHAYVQDGVDSFIITKIKVEQILCKCILLVRNAKAVKFYIVFGHVGNCIKSYTYSMAAGSMNRDIRKGMIPMSQLTIETHS
jgi:hypothetical protein